MVIGHSIDMRKAAGAGYLNVGVDMNYTYTTGQKDLTAHFNQSTPFTLNSERQKGAFNVGVNAEYGFAKGFSVKAGINQRFNKRGNDWSGGLQVKYKF